MTMSNATKEQEIQKLIDQLSYEETIDFMKFLINENKKEALDKKAKPATASTTDDAMLRRRLGM